MYLRKYTDKRINKTYLSIARGYQNTEGKTRTKIVQYLGCLEDLQKQYDDPISHFKNLIKQMNEEEKSNKVPLTLTIDKNEKLEVGTDNNKNFGYSALSKIYHELEIDKFIKLKFRNRNFSEYKINNIIKLLVFARCLFPDSKKSTFENYVLLFVSWQYQRLFNLKTYGSKITKKLFNW